MILSAEKNLEQVSMGKFRFFVSNAVEISILVIMLFVSTLCKESMRPNEVIGKSTFYKRRLRGADKLFYSISTVLLCF